MNQPALKPDLSETEQQLVAIKPFSAANAATIVMLMMSIPTFCAIKFFQYFDGGVTLKTRTRTSPPAKKAA